MWVSVHPTQVCWNKFKDWHGFIATDKPRRTADTYVPSATRRYNKYKEVDPGFAEFARPVAKVSKYAAPIVDYDGESADEGEIREVAQIEDEEI